MLAVRMSAHQTRCRSSPDVSFSASRGNSIQRRYSVVSAFADHMGEARRCATPRPSSIPCRCAPSTASTKLHVGSHVMNSRNESNSSPKDGLRRLEWLLDLVGRLGFIALTWLWVSRADRPPSTRGRWSLPIEAGSGVVQMSFREWRFHLIRVCQFRGRPIEASSHGCDRILADALGRFYGHQLALAEVRCSSLVEAQLAHAGQFTAERSRFILPANWVLVGEQNLQIQLRCHDAALAADGKTAGRG